MTAAKLVFASALLPTLLILAAVPNRGEKEAPAAWDRFRWLSLAALVSSLFSLGQQLTGTSSWQQDLAPGLGVTLMGAWIAVLVQLLGTTIGFFSSRYLQGEPGQARYVALLGGLLSTVHILLLATHWLVLIAAWAAVGMTLQHLLCFYKDRPFALLAAHKKRLADRVADVLLVAAAAISWREVGSGSLPALWRHLEAGATSNAMQASAVCLALAVILRTALLPVHGWLTQVMEAPTPVSALLHAGVVNLGGFVLILFAPLLEAAPVARWLLVCTGVATALLAGLVMLTRVSIKVRLAWSTVAQMGFMVVECGLGLYTLALLHLIGHSLYKANAFLAASKAVEGTRLRMMWDRRTPSIASLAAAPVVAAGLVTLLASFVPWDAWPWWWSGVLALAWAPLMWLPAARHPDGPSAVRRSLASAGMVVGLTFAALVGHALPFGVLDAPDQTLGLVALTSMAALYLCLATLQASPLALTQFRRWSYAGFYVDEFVTRAVLRLSPTRWTPVADK